MRPVLVATILALALAGPASASPEGGTGGAAMSPRNTGGMVVPGEAETRPPPIGKSAHGAGGARAGESALRRSALPRSVPPARESMPGAAAQAPEGEQPVTPPAEEVPDDGEVNVEVPIDDGGQDAGATQPTPSDAPFGGLASTGMAVAAFAALGTMVAAAGAGLRRLAR